jgi:hypothetical protein
MRGVCYQGQWVSLKKACALAGQPYQRVLMRLRAGWTLDAALTRPRCPGKSLETPDGVPLRHRSLAWAIQRYLLAHPEEARRLAAKYGWTDL